MKSPCGCTKLDIWSLFDSLVLVICFSFKSSHMVGRASQGTCECLLSAAVYICQRSFNYFSSAKVHVSSPERFRIPISFNNGLNILCSSLLRFFVWGEIAIFSVSIQEVSDGSRSTELKWVVFIYFFLDVPNSIFFFFHDMKKLWYCQFGLKYNERWSHIPHPTIRLTWWLSLKTISPALFIT